MDVLLGDFGEQIAIEVVGLFKLVDVVVDLSGLVIEFALVFIGEDVVGFDELLEVFFGLGVPLVFVGMEFECEFPVGLFLGVVRWEEVRFGVGWRWGRC